MFSVLCTLFSFLHQRSYGFDGSLWACMVSDVSIRYNVVLVDIIGYMEYGGAVYQAETDDRKCFDVKPFVL